MARLAPGAVGSPPRRSLRISPATAALHEYQTAHAIWLQQETLLRAMVSWEADYPGLARAFWEPLLALHGEMRATLDAWQALLNEAPPAG